MRVSTKLLSSTTSRFATLAIVHADAVMVTCAMEQAWVLHSLFAQRNAIQDVASSAALNWTISFRQIASCFIAFDASCKESE